VPSTLARYVADYVDRRRLIHNCRSTTRQWISHFSQMMMQKWSKMQHIFAHNWLPWGATAQTAPWLTFLESPRRADVKLQLTCNAAIYRFRDIRFLKGQNLDLSDLGRTVPKRGEDLSGTDMYHRAKFHADRCHRRRDICNRTETTETETNIPFHTLLRSVWWVKNLQCTERLHFVV